jgi:hypothetical protein
VSGWNGIQESAWWRAIGKGCTPQEHAEGRRMQFRWPIVFT